MLGQQMAGLPQPQPIIIDDYIKIEEDYQSQAEAQPKQTKKEKKQAKTYRKIKIVHNEKDNFYQKEEQKSQEIKQKKKYSKRKQLKQEIDKTKLKKTKIQKNTKRALSNYNVYFRERNKSLKNLSFQDKAVMIAKEWSLLSSEQKGLYSDKPNIDLSSILNQTRDHNRKLKQDEMIPAAERTEQNGEGLILYPIKSEYDEPQKLNYSYEPAKQLI